MMRQFSAGGVVYKREKGRVLWLLRKGALNPDFPGSGDWSLPKGWLDDEEGDKPGPMTLGKKRATKTQLEEAAIREVREETGVDVRVIERAGEVKFFFVNRDKERVFKTVIFFLMKHIADLPEGYGWETEEVKWVDKEEAKGLLGKRKDEAEMIVKAERMIRV